MDKRVETDKPVGVWPRRYKNLETGLVRTFWREPRHGYWALIDAPRRPLPPHKEKAE